MFSPFAGWLFDPARVGDVGDATSPPYDVIDPAEHRALLAASPHNVVRLLLATDDDPGYTQAAATLERWCGDGSLRRDDGPRFYVYEMEYTAPDGRRRTAAGLLGALDLVELGTRVVPHEETMAKHRADRLAVLSATQANIDPIIALSAAPDLAPLLATRAAPRLAFTTADGVDHRLFDITEPDRIATITGTVAGHAVAIADGHHRYTTALGYRNGRDDDGDWTAILALVAPATGSGLTVGPYHRVFPALAFDPDRVTDAFSVQRHGGPPAPGEIVIVTGGERFRLSPLPEALGTLPEPWREASTAVARELLYPLLGVTEDDAGYVADANDAIDATPPGGSALLVAPVTERAMSAAGRDGLRFPQKSTYFVPKPRAGLVIRRFDR